MSARALAFSFGVATAALLGPHPALAGYETEVLTAAEKGNPIDIHFSFGYDRSLKQAKIVREWIQDPLSPGGVKQAIDVKELRYIETTNRLLLNLRAGIYHDLELHVTAPIILSQDSLIRFALGVQGTSTIIGSQNADDPNYDGIPRYPITDVPQQRFRSGFGDMIFGLAWSPFTDKKDEAWPTVTLRGDITAPTGNVHDPTDQNALTAAARGGVGLGQTIFDLSVGVSRRFIEGTPWLDPYLRFGAEIPIASSGQQARGMDPAPTGRFVVGTEVVLVDIPQDFQHYSFDVSFETKFVGTARTYSELSDFLPSFDPTRVLGNRTGPITQPDVITYGDFNDPRNYASRIDGAHCGSLQGVPCGELNQVEEYVTIKAALAATFRFAEYAMVRAGVAFSHDSDHFLTNERVGKDLDPPTSAEMCDGAPCAGKVNARNSFYDRANDTCPPGKTCDERNKYFDPRYDTPGRRFRIEEQTNFTFFVSGIATF
ncbi:MAG: hypothetical protein U1E65_12240 [Myxococcota bacterium]